MKHRLQLFFGILVIAAIIVWTGVFSSASTADNSLHIYFLNVGQGDSEYIKMPDGQDALIDGGPDSAVLGELGKVMDFGDRKIDLIVLTHPHADHLAGLIDVTERYEVGEIWQTGISYPSDAYQTFENKIKEKNVPITLVKKGENKNFGEVKIFVLSPLSSLKNLNIDNVNNSSIILRLTDGNFSALFLGDAEKSVQAQILNDLQTTTVVKVAHHGSTNALNEDLYKKTRPALAVIEVGAGNSYGHPHAAVISFLKSLAIQIYRTDQNGTIEVSSDGNSWRVKTDK